MPAVLVELGFLTNADQEKQLAGDEHQNALVQALVEGIVRYPRRGRRHALMIAASRDRRDRRLRPRPRPGSCSSACRAGMPRGRRRRGAPPRRRRAGRRAGGRGPQDHRHALLRQRRRHGAGAGAARSPVRRDRRRNRRARSSRRRSRPAPRRWSRRFPPRPKCATCSSPSAATRSSICPARSAPKPSRRLARRDLHGLHHRQRAHGEPAGR